MDPLSEWLSSLETQSSYFVGLRAGGNWAIETPPPEAIKFIAVVDGRCWLQVDDAGPPVLLNTGDCFLLATPRRFVLSSEPGLPPVAADDVYRDLQNGVAHYGEPANCFLIGGRFTFGDNAQLLLGGLPPVIIVRSRSEPATVLNWALERLTHELTTPALGAPLMVRHLALMMLVQMLRQYADEHVHNGAGWLNAFADPRIAIALAAVHREPARSWTVADLATRCYLSRSTFAARFKQRMGFGPLEYVLRWRMQLATRMLHQSDVSISQVAQSLGYDSDSAFSHAFKRIVGSSPREFRSSVSPAGGTA